MRWLGLALTVLMLAACASAPSLTPQTTQAPAPDTTASAPVPQKADSDPRPAQVLRQFAGRVAVTIESEPVQFMSAEFELEGDANAGELRLYGPWVGLVAVLQWEPGRAVLIEGQRRRVVKSIDALIERVTGAPIPLSMVFDWLHHRPVPNPDWWVEARTSTQDRLRAIRLQPLPRIELTMVLNKAAP